MFRTARQAASFFCLSAMALSAEESLDISGFPIDRYQAILEKSPFAKETVPEAAAPGPLFGQDLMLTGHYRLGSTVYVYLLDRKTQQRIIAHSDESRADRPKLVSLSIEAEPSKTTALVQLGVEKATIRFEAPAQPKAENNEKAGQSSSGTNVSSEGAGVPILPRLKPITPAVTSGGP